MASPPPAKEALRDSTVKRAQFLLSKHRLTEREVYDFVREFFKAYLDLKYEFTLDELQVELNRVYLDSALKGRLRTYLTGMRHIEYADAALPHDALAAHIAEFMELVKGVLPEQPVEQHPWHRRFRHWLAGTAPEAEQLALQSGESQLFPTEEAAIARLEADQEARRSERTAHAPPRIETLLSGVTDLLARHEAEAARAAYAELAAHYEGLDEHQKTLYFDQVQLLFEELMNAEQAVPRPMVAEAPAPPTHAESAPPSFDFSALIGEPAGPHISVDWTAENAIDAGQTTASAEKAPATRAKPDKDGPWTAWDD